MLLLAKVEIEVSQNGKILKVESIEVDIPYLNQDIQSFINREKKEKHFSNAHYKLKSFIIGNTEYERTHPTFIEIQKIIENLTF